MREIRIEITMIIARESRKERSAFVFRVVNKCASPAMGRAMHVT